MPQPYKFNIGDFVSLVLPLHPAYEKATRSVQLCRPALCILRVVQRYQDECPAGVAQVKYKCRPLAIYFWSENQHILHPEIVDVHEFEIEAYSPEVELGLRQRAIEELASRGEVREAEAEAKLQALVEKNRKEKKL